jgi:hypothetical protein
MYRSARSAGVMPTLSWVPTVCEPREVRRRLGGRAGGARTEHRADVEAVAVELGDPLLVDSDELLEALKQRVAVKILRPLPFSSAAFSKSSEHALAAQYAPHSCSCAPC